jgi:hypothetical protein
MAETLIMSIRPIDENELRKRITEHLAARPGMTDVAMFWHGFVLALSETGIIDTDAAERVVKLLPPHDWSAVKEAMLGEEYLAEHPTREGAMEAA